MEQGDGDGRHGDGASFQSRSASAAEEGNRVAVRRFQRERHPRVDSGVVEQIRRIVGEDCRQQPRLALRLHQHTETGRERTEADLRRQPVRERHFLDQLAVDVDPNRQTVDLSA